MRQITTIEVGTKIFKLSIEDFDTEVDVDEILTIQYDNIFAEIITIPVLLNKIGVLRAEMEERARLEKFDVNVYHAQVYEEKRKQLWANAIAEGKKRGPSKETVEHATLLDANYKLKKHKLFRVEREYAFIDSIYWSVKDKSKKLETLSAKLSPSEFEKDILDQTINMVRIKGYKKSIQ